MSLDSVDSRTLSVPLDSTMLYNLKKMIQKQKNECMALAKSYLKGWDANHDEKGQSKIINDFLE